MAMVTVEGKDVRLVGDAEIKGFLERYGIEFERWPIPERIAQLSARPELTDTEKREVLDAFRGKLDELARTRGYVEADLVVLHPETPGLDTALAKFDKEHFHTDDEVRYIVDGRGIFGFAAPDGTRFLLEVHSGDYVVIPKDSWHWFELCEDRRIKAIRIFKDTAGWVPFYRQAQQ